MLVLEEYDTLVKRGQDLRRAFWFWHERVMFYHGRPTARIPTGRSHAWLKNAMK